MPAFQYIVLSATFLQTYTDCSSWQDLLMSHSSLCPWHIITLEWQWLGRNWQVFITVMSVSSIATPTVHLGKICWRHMMLYIIALPSVSCLTYTARWKYSVLKCCFRHTYSKCSSLQNLMTSNGTLIPCPKVYAYNNGYDYRYNDYFYTNQELHQRSSLSG